MTRLAAFVLVGAALALAAVPVSAAAQATAQRQQSVRFLLASNGAPPRALDVGRTPVLRQRLTLDLEGVTVREALTAISDRARLVLWYTDDVIAADRRVNLRADEITVAAALTDVLVDAGVDVVFNRDGSAVIVKRLASVVLVQVGTVVGRVTDSTSREGVAGVTIAVEGTRLSTTTAADGRYTISGVAAGNRSVTARRLGFVRQSRAVTVTDDESVILDFSLAQAPTTLTEVVTTATGDQLRVELGHVVGRINADSVVKAAPVSSLSELLNGRVAGLQVNTHQGTVGGDVSLQIRGRNSIQLSNEPIVIVDGIRYTSRHTAKILFGGVNATEPTSPLNDLNPNEIELIEVVKGPSAATLYGTDAANGVIVITTKRGRPGLARWNTYFKSAQTEIPNIHYPESYWGWHTFAGAPALSDCPLVHMARGICTQDSVSVIENPLNDPARTIFQRKPRWEYGANVSGGSEHLRYFLAGDIEQATGPLRIPPAMVDSISQERRLPREQIEPNGFSKFNIRSNLSFQIGRAAEVQVNAGYNHRETRTPGLGLNNPYANILTMPTPESPFGYSGAPSELFSRTSLERVSRLYASANGHWSPNSWLVTRMSGGMDIASIGTASLIRRGEAPLALGSEGELGTVQDDRGRRLATTGEVAAVATFSSGRLRSRTSIGTQLVRTVDDIVGTYGMDLPPGTSTIGAAASVQSRQTYREQVTLGSYVEQTIGLNERLFLTGALRRDGASTFGRNYAAAIYPKASVSWLISQEPLFPRLPILNDLRLRYAFGASGQQPRPEWARPGYAVQQAFYDGGVVNVYTVNALGNPNLRPEQVREHEFGFDGNALAQRLEVGLTWYRRKTMDQIVSVEMQPGLGTMQTNIGLTTGRGFEAQISARPVESQGLSWHVAFQHSFHRTMLEELGDATALRDVFGGWAEGFPLGARFRRRLIGYDDANGDGLINPFTELQIDTALVYAGESSPPRSQTLTNTFGLLNGRLRLSALLERRSGFTQHNALLRGRCQRNRCRELVDPSTPLEEQAAAAAVTFANYSFVEPGDFIRLRELGVAVDLPATMINALRLRSATVSLQGRNLALWTSYGGIDPESASLPSSQEAYGASTARNEESGIPQAKTWIFRFDVGF